MRLFGTSMALGTALTIGAVACAEDNMESLVPEFRGTTAAEKDSVTDGLVERRRKLIAGLVRQLRTVREGQEHIMYLLGQYRAKEATGILVEMIDFKAKIVDLKTRIARWGAYPAQEALSRIGKPAVERILQELPTETNELRKKLMCMVLLDIEGKEIGKLVLEKLAEEEEETERRTRIEAAIQFFETYGQEEAAAERSGNKQAIRGTGTVNREQAPEDGH